VKQEHLALPAVIIVALGLGTWTIQEEEIPAYDRALFRHWTDADGDCQNTRAEILIAQNMGGTITFRTDEDCTVDRGLWVGPYSWQLYTEAADLDIDHLVSLKDAWESGAYGWTADEREAYANDARGLVAVDASLNRQKGALGLEAWVPPHPEARCWFARAYVEVKTRWDLTITAAQAEVAEASCP
tara:strand:- start:40691 stop:41248 length:558 start_codon:yes stop_codon:yes gene_type:complete